MRGGPGPRRAAVFASPAEVLVGMVVFDRDAEMPGVVRGTIESMVALERPTGLFWQVNYRRLRRGTPWERRQLRALARLHEVRLRGVGAPLPPPGAMSTPRW